MSDYKIFQGQIIAKDPITPRQYTVAVIPSGQKLVGVQLPNALKDQSTPLLNSMVLVLQLDAYKAYILQVLREPYNFLTLNSQYRGFVPSTGDLTTDISAGANPLQDGEIYMESAGPQSPNGQITPGFGASLYLGNNGCAQIQSGSMGERLVIGGTSSDDDHEVVLSANNGYFESNTGKDSIQSTFNFTTNAATGLTEGLQIATQLSVPVGLTTVETPICQLTMDTIGNILLENTTVGTGVPLASMIMDSTGNISLKGTTVVLNNGTLGAARLNDTTISNTSTDPLYWQFVSAIQAFFTAISVLSGGTPVTQSQLGALGQVFLAQVPTAPTSLTGKISSGSGSVFIGG